MKWNIIDFHVSIDRTNWYVAYVLSPEGGRYLAFINIHNVGIDMSLPELSSRSTDNSPTEYIDNQDEREPFLSGTYYLFLVMSYGE